MSCRSEGRLEHSTGLPDVDLPSAPTIRKKQAVKCEGAQTGFFDAVADAVYGPAKGEADLVRFLNGDGGKGLKKSSRNQRESSREDAAIHRQCNSGDECSSR